MRVFFNRWEAVAAGDVVGAMFIAQRAVLGALRDQVLAGTGLTPELAEILVELYLAGSHLSSPEHADTEGFVPFRDLRGALGYSAGLLSRRIGWLAENHWVETQRARPSAVQGLHGNCQKVRITELGREKIAPIWQGYDSLAQRLLAGISPSDLAAHYRINEAIVAQLRLPRPIQEIGRAETPVESPSPSARRVRSTRHPAPAAQPLPPKPFAEKTEPEPKHLLHSASEEFLD